MGEIGGTSWWGGRRPAGATACHGCGAQTAPGDGEPQSPHCPCSLPSPEGTAARGNQGTGSRPTCRVRGRGRGHGEPVGEANKKREREGILTPLGRVEPGQTLCPPPAVLLSIMPQFLGTSHSRLCRASQTYQVPPTTGPLHMLFSLSGMPFLFC